MHRIDVPSASTSLPAPRAYGTPGYFQEGNPLTGVDATIVDEDWTNAVQEELVAIVLAAGISLDKANRAQVLAAIRAISSMRGVLQFSTPGTTTFVVPANVTTVEVEVWGAGAGSFASYGPSGWSAGGAAGGGYSRKRITGLTSGATIAVTVGAGGIAGTTAGPSWPWAGGTSSFGGYCSATGGTLNTLSTPTAASVQFGGGPGGIGSGGDLNIQGWSGALASGNQGGIAGGAPIGGGVGGGGGAGVPGIAPGGGASGPGTGSANNTSQNGAAGANGLVMVRW